jgi:hypothetical protein
MIGYEQKLTRVLDRMGGLYTLDDILERLGDGRMQSFAVNNSLAVTEIGVFPRARKLHVVVMVGDIADGEALHDKVLEFARKVEVPLISADGRRGWLPQAEAHGWRVKARSYLYQREL